MVLGSFRTSSITSVASQKTSRGDYITVVTVAPSLEKPWAGSLIFHRIPQTLIRVTYLVTKSLAEFNL